MSKKLDNCQNNFTDPNLLLNKEYMMSYITKNIICIISQYVDPQRKFKKIN